MPAVRKTVPARNRRLSHWLTLCRVVSAIEAEGKQFARRNDFRHRHCGDKESYPNGTRHPETCLREVLTDRDYEKCQPKAGCWRHPTYTLNGSAIRGDENQSQQCNPYPSQIQIYFKVTIMGLVQIHTGQLLHMFIPRSEPEACEARPHNRTFC